VSRWSAEPLRVALAPGEIALVRGARTQMHETGARDAPALLPALDELLADAAWRTGRVEVVLSQHFVRHVLTPPPGKALPPAEERALVAAGLREIYGEPAQTWAVRVHSQPPHAGLLGAAIDGAFAHALDALLTQHGFRRIAIRPLASLAARHAPRTVNGWWLLAEPGWLGIFGGADGCWRHVAGFPVGAGWQAALPDLLARERGAAPAELPAAVWLHGLGAGALATPHDPGLRWHVLPHDARLHGAQAWLAL
jgi:hypothetical protein